MKAFVLCANDGIEAVVLEDEEKANAELLNLKEKHWERFRHSFSSREHFDDMIYWHLHEVPVI